MPTESNRGAEIAARVMYWVRRRGMTRAVFAARMGRSVTWVAKLKNGDRQLDRLSVLEQIAGVLDVDLAVLVGSPVEVRSAGEAQDARDLRRALQRYDGLCGASTAPAMSLTEIERQLDYGWKSFLASRFRPICSMLYRVLPALQQHMRDDAAWPLAARHLVHAYQLATEVAFKLDKVDLGYLAADRGIQVSEQLDDVLLTADTSRRLVHALMYEPVSRPDALALLGQMVNRLESSGQPRSDAYLAILGSLLLKGAITAARSDNPSQSQALHAAAGETARELGKGFEEPWAMFSGANVAIHRVSALIDLRQPGMAVEVAREIPRSDIASLAPERKARHLLDIAMGLVHTGQRDKASEILWRADQISQDEVRGRVLTRRLIHDLVRSYPTGTKLPPSLTAIARSVSITT